MAQINLRVEDELKRKADRIFNELGLSMSSAFYLFLKATVRHNGIPFDMTLAAHEIKENTSAMEKPIFTL